MLVVSYATPAYAAHAARLVRSCDACGVPYRVELRSSRGDWTRNGNDKASFLLGMLASHEGVLWLDADAEVAQPLPESIPQAFGVHRLRGVQVCSGTLWVTRDARPLLEEWQRVCERRPHKSDQLNLEVALRGARDPRGFDLSPAWCWIDDISERFYGPRIIAPYVVHHQASRTLREVECESRF